ncbi:hypothetical protein Taro_053151, partial [Colocasia esculenta]|nr:hypothetical protein [Colocasia esculenta]
NSLAAMLTAAPHLFSGGGHQDRTFPLDQKDYRRGGSKGKVGGKRRTYTYTEGGERERERERERELAMSATAPPPAACTSGAGGRILLCSRSVVLGWPREISAIGGVPARIRGVRRWRRGASLLHAFPRKGHSSSRPRLTFAAKAVDSSQPSASTSTSASAVSDKAVVNDDEFSLAKVSFGVIGLAVGCTLLSYGFGAYFSILPGSEWSALMLTYGFPLAIIGMALKYAELKPVPCITYSDAKTLREGCATPILKQVRNDVTRYRYGDEQHLDEALKRIFQYGQ